MRFILTLAALALAFTLPAQARPLDRGGLISRYQQEIAAARGPHVIAGDCLSACTLWLGYRGSCVEPDAVLWVHSASSGWPDRNPWADRNAIGSAIMADSYPPALRRLVLAHGWLATPEFHTLTGREVIGLGARACK